jgi:hypothetical protein
MAERPPPVGPPEGFVDGSKGAQVRAIQIFGCPSPQLV